jgi:hypothetical protein
MVEASNYAPCDCDSRLNDNRRRDLVMAQIKKNVGNKVRGAEFDGVITSSFRNCLEMQVTNIPIPYKGNSGRLFSTG